MKSSFLLIVLAIVGGVAAIFVDLSNRVELMENVAIEDLSAAGERIAALESYVDTQAATKAVDAKSGKVGEKVVQLPQDQGAWHLSVWYASKDDAASRRLSGYLTTDPVMTQIVSQVINHRHFATEPDAVFNARYASEATPGIMLQNSRGVVLYKATGANIPSSGAQLAEEILAELGIKSQDCPDGNCPVPPEQFRRPIPDRRPNRRDTSKPSELEGVALLALVLVIVGAGAYLLTQPQQQRPPQ